MPLASRTISNLFGGVSQQPAGVRLDNQCEEMVNCYPSITDGLVKRPPTEFIAGIGATLWITVSMSVAGEATWLVLDSANLFLINVPGIAQDFGINISGFSHPGNNGIFQVTSVNEGGALISPQEGQQPQAEAAGNVISITNLGVI